jgi:hypothetical protein
MKDVLRTRSPDEEAYLTYIATLVAQGRLPRDLTLSTFQWARKKPYPKKVEYFKQAIIQRAAEQGIRLPQGTPDLTGTIQGRVVLNILVTKVPVAGVTVQLVGTKRTATTDTHGQFRFTDVPFGSYRLEATGVVSFITRSGRATAILPSPPPSTEPVTVEIVLH